MKEPVRLRDGAGPAQVLMGGSGLYVPSASRRRALAFTGAAATLAASGTAVAAGATSLVKSVVLCVCLGTVGGGLVSLAASETFSRMEATQVAAKPAAAPKFAAPRGSAAAVVAPSLEQVVVAPETVEAAVEPVAPVAEPPPAAASGGATPSATAGSAKPYSGPSLFEEQRIIESARAAVARGDAASALSTLDSYERTYSQRQFRPEALALRIEALSTRGELGRARSLAAQFSRSYPHHPLLSRVQAAVQAP